MPLGCGNRAFQRDEPFCPNVRIADNTLTTGQIGVTFSLECGVKLHLEGIRTRVIAREAQPFRIEQTSLTNYVCLLCGN